MKRTTTISTTRRAAMTLLVMLLTTMTAWGQEAIDGLTYNSTGGYYEINDEQDLIDLATYVYKNYSNGKTFKQTQPITMSGGNFTPIGSGYPFRHTYDGNGYAISGLIVNGNYNCAGLFGHVSSGTLRNVILLSPIVTSTKASSDDIYCGALAGSCYNTTVENCHFVSPTVSATNTGSGAKHLGALFGEFTGGSTATNCYFYGGNQSNVNGLGTYNTMTNVASTDYTAKLPDGVTATGSGFITGGTGYFVGGSTVNLPAAPVGYIYTYTVEGSPIDGTSFTINADVTVALSRTPNPADFSVNDAGTEYTIHTAVGWDVFCDLLAENDKGYFDGKTVKLGADIGTADEPVTRMAGTSGHEFTGTFDGDVKTLTFSAAAADNYVAPFYGVQGTSAAHAVIKDLNVVTTITANDYRHVAGLVAVTKGYVDISGCNATVNISATVGENNKSDLYPSGLVSQAAKLSGNGKITVSHCSVSGTITTDGKYAAGLVGITQCEAAVTDCRSSVTINSSTAIVDNDNNVNHDGSHGGLIGCTSSGTVTIEGCLFNGRLLSNNGTNNCGGFVGWRNTGLEIHNSLFDPVEANIEKEGSATFVRNNVDTYNCYYTYLLNDDSHYKPQYDESSSVWRNGRAPRTVIGGENVTVSNIALTGEETEYNVSGITAYSGGGLKRTVSNETTLYYGSDDQVSLTLSADTPPEGYGFGGYTASPDGTTLTEDGDNYTLTMPDADVTISADWLRLPYVTVNVTGSGTVTCGEQNATDGNPFDVTTEKGASVALTLAPTDGNAVRSVAYGYTNNSGTTASGIKLPISGTTATLTVPDDLMDGTGVTVTVTFAPALNGGADEASAVALTDATVTDLGGGWYKVDSDISFDHTLNLLGDTHLIIADGKTMTVNTASNRGIYSDYTLFVSGEGTLSVTTTGNYGIAVCVGNYVQTGATVTASGSYGIRCTDDFIAFNFTNDFTFSGGQLTATGNSGGIWADNDITLSCTNATDFIQASSYSSGYGAVKIAEGKALTDGTEASNGMNGYSGTLTDEQRIAIGGKTLHRAVTTSYVDASGTLHENVIAIPLDNTMTTLAAGWYVVNENVDYTGQITLNGDVNLILADGKTMTLNGNMTGIDGGCNLTIYGQSLDDATAGTLRYNGTADGIIANNYEQHSGNVSITTTGYWVYGINAYVTLRGGTLTISANGDNARAINGTTHSILGGQLTATGTGADATGIYAEAYDGTALTLGWTRPADRITASSISTNGGTVAVADGQELFDEDGNYYSGNDVTIPNGKTLRPLRNVLALYDSEDNSEAISGSNGQQRNVILYGRTLSKSGEWNTLCLPFDIDDFSGTPLEGATVKELDTEGSYEGHQTGLDGTTLYLYFQDATSIKAGKPYIVKWQGASGSVSDPVFSGVTVSSTTPTAVTSYDKKVTFVGQYSPFSIGDTSSGTFDGDINEIIMLGTGSKLGYSKSARTLRSFRCHFYVPAEGSEPGARAFVLDFDGETTEIISPAEIKEITEMAGAWYSLDGRKLDAKPTKKGLYIHNGNKVVIK